MIDVGLIRDQIKVQGKLDLIVVIGESRDTADFVPKLIKVCDLSCHECSGAAGKWKLNDGSGIKPIYLKGGDKP